jgi:hypothetical protein
LIVKALHVLQGEFPSRDVRAYPFDHPVMIAIRASAIQRLIDGFGKYRNRISRAPHFRQALFRVWCSSVLGSGLVFSHCDSLHDL